MMSARTTLAWIVVLLLTLAPASASEYQGGTQSPLRFGVGARELSLGGAAIVDCDAATAQFWNAAMLANAEYLSFYGFHTQLFESDVTYQYAGIAVPTLDFGTLGFGVQRLGVSNIERRDSENLLTGHYSDNRFGFHLGYGGHWGSYQLGIAVGLEHHSLDSYSATSTPGVNLSLMRSFGPISGWCRHINIAVAANNVLGSSVELHQESTVQPTTLETGLSFGLFPNLSHQHNLELFSKLTKVDDIDVTAAAGLEYTYADMLKIRGGLRGTDWSTGVGLAYKGFSFDYALVDRRLGLLHMFAVTTTLGASTSERRLARAERRETEFQDRMREQLTEKNRKTVEELVLSGQEAVESGFLLEAVSSFDKALFVAKSSGVDTIPIASLLTDASHKLDQEQRMRAHNAYLDSARFHLTDGNTLNARYFGSLALNAYPESADARDLLDRINQSLKDDEAKEAMVIDQMRQIDSLLTYGRYDVAIPRAKSLREIAPEDGTVGQLLRRAEFGSLRERGDRAFAAADYELALSIVREAETLFPEHQWCVSLKDRVAEARRSRETQQPPRSPKVELSLTDASRKQVERLYRDGQAVFDQGNFEDAIATWERVELLAPDYLSVREYLVQAYKYLGVEHYGNNALDQALTLWRRAAELMPDSQEINSYIKRTEAEMATIRELSYEP